MSFSLFSTRDLPQLKTNRNAYLPAIELFANFKLIKAYYRRGNENRITYVVLVRGEIIKILRKTYYVWRNCFELESSSVGALPLIKYTLLFTYMEREIYTGRGVRK